MGLEPVGQLVARHSSETIEKQLKIDKEELDRAITRQMFNWIIRGMIVLGIGVAMLIVNKYFDIGGWFSLLASTLLLGGTGIATAGVLNAVRQSAGLSGKRPTDQISETSGAKSLPTNPIPALPSVTERTTRLIAPDEPGAKHVINESGREVE